MSVLRIAAIASAFGLLLFTAAAAPVSASNPPDVGCGGPDVEVCMPVCVTEPCNGYVCVHRYVEICREL